ncbi:MAG: hypothetical protein R3C59_08905 [Planctomycetaceae bacterium]
MKTKSVFQDCLLSAALAAVPAACLASDLPAQSSQRTAAARQTVSGHVGVGQHPRYIQPVRYQPASRSHFIKGQQTAEGQAQTSTVNAELTRMFQENGRPVPVLPSAHTMVQPGPGADGGIALVQHESDGDESNSSAKKPGLFKRFFQRVRGNKITAENDKPWINSEPGMKLPAPPPIVYPDGNNSANRNRGVPTKPAGFSQPGSPAEKNQPSVARRRTLPDDGFINPFEDQTAGQQQEDTLLDLESLVNSRQSANEAAQGPPTASPQADNSLVPQAALTNEPDTSKEQPAAESSANARPSTGPFTGYQLPSDDEVLGLPEPTTVSEPQPASAQRPEPVSEPTPEPQGPAAADVNEPQIIKVPLLEEPAMALPPVVESNSARKTEETAEAFLVSPQPEPEVQTVTPAAQPETLQQQQQQVQPEAVQESVRESSASNAQPEPKPAGLPDLRVLDDQAKREQQRYRIMARTGLSGFKGFCPVELRDHRELIDSREQYTAKFGLQSYQFSSPEAKSAFEANPARYAPAGGGCDVVLLVNTGEETAGSLDFSLWYRDRLYMFRSRETQSIFSQNPKRYADQY